MRRAGRGRRSRTPAAPRRLKPLAAVPSTTKYVNQTVTMKPEWRAGEAACIDDRSAGYKLDFVVPDNTAVGETFTVRIPLAQTE